jgi:hypothetical protein
VGRRGVEVKLSEAASWAEIISAVGLVVSLIYVGIQVTDNTSAMRSETASNASTQFIDWYTHLSGDPELMDVWLRGVTAPETLDEQQSLRFVFLLHIIMLQFQNNYYLVEEGTLDEKMLYAINNTLATIRGTPGFELYWSLRRELFNREYQAFVERLMFESEGLPNPSYQR